MPTQSGMSAPVKVMAPVLDGVDGVSGDAYVSGQHGMTSLSLRALYANAVVHARAVARINASASAGEKLAGTLAF